MTIKSLIRLFLLLFLVSLTSGLSKTVVLRCDFGTPKCDPEFRACYFCNIQNMNVREKNVKVSSLKATSSDEGVNDTQILIMENQIVYFMPKQFTNFVPKTKVLKIISSGLRELSFNDLKEFHHLTELYVTGNELTFLPFNLLQIDANIAQIDFSGNKIKNVGINFFYSKNIYGAKFLNNVCINTSSDSLEDGVSGVAKQLEIKCPPTHPMIIDQINWLQNESKLMREKLAKCYPQGFLQTTTNRPCRKRAEVDFRGQVDLTTLCRD